MYWNIKFLERYSMHLTFSPTLLNPPIVKSFTAMACEVLAEPRVQYLLSEKISQDPLEEHFGKQRGMGGRHKNPDARQFGSNMGVLQVANSCISASLKADVQRQSGKSLGRNKTGEELHKYRSVSITEHRPWTRISRWWAGIGRWIPPKRVVISDSDTD